MDKPVITVQQLAALYPTSYKVVSEKLTLKNMQALQKKQLEVNARLTAQESGNKKLTEDLATANSAFKKAEDEATLLKADKVNQQKEIDRLKPFENKILEIQDKGKGTPGEDANSRNEGTTVLPANHPNSVALAAWKAAHPNAK